MSLEFFEFKPGPERIKKLLQGFHDFCQLSDDRRTKFQQALDPRMLCSQELLSLKKLNVKVNELLVTCNLMVEKSDLGMEAASIASAFNAQLELLVRTLNTSLVERAEAIIGDYRKVTGLPYVEPDEES